MLREKQLRKVDSFPTILVGLICAHHQKEVELMLQKEGRKEYVYL